MQADPAYVGAIPDRTEALEARLLYSFHDPHADPDQSFAVESQSEQEAFVVSLLRLDHGKQPAWSRPSDAVLNLDADQPMVSDGLWHRLVVTRYPSVEAAQTHTSIDKPGVVDAIDLVTQPAPWSFPLPSGH